MTSGRGADGVLVCAASKSAGAARDRDRSRPRARHRLHRRGRGDRVAASAAVRQGAHASSSRAPMVPGATTRHTSRSGIDYPAGYVRWTEGRNLDEVLRLMATGQLRPARVTTHTFDLDAGVAAYALLESAEPSLGIVLRYPGGADARPAAFACAGRRAARRIPALTTQARLRVGVVGAGAFARSVLMPPLSRGADIVAVAAATGVSARSSATRFGAALATTDAARRPRFTRRRRGRHRDTPRHAREVRGRRPGGRQARVRREAAGAQRGRARAASRRPPRDASGDPHGRIQPPLRAARRRAACRARRPRAAG